MGWEMDGRQERCLGIYLSFPGFLLHVYCKRPITSWSDPMEVMF